MTNHLVLTVHGLPSAGNPAGDWYVDVGLGDALFEPQPLRAGTYHQPPFTLRLEETPGGVGDWHLTHDPAGSFPGMAWRNAPTDLSAFEAMNTFLSTSPESGFVRTLSLQRRHAGAVDILRGLVLLRVGDGAGERTLRSPDELGEGTLGALWERTRAAHLAWEAAGRP